MKDEEKSKEQLINELEELRQEKSDLKHSNREKSSDLSSISSDDQWQMTFDAIPDMVALIDDDFRIKKMNKSMSELLGVDAQDILGTHCFSMVHGTEKPPDYCPHAKLLRDEHPHIAEFYEEKLNKHIIISVNPIFNGDQQIMGSVHIMHDDTKRKLAEEALKKSETRYYSLFENMLDGLAYCKMMFDDEGRPADWIYLNVNQAFEELTGLEDIEGKNVREAIPNIQELQPELFDIYGRVTLTGKPERIEIYFKPLEIWLDISVFSPEPEYFVAVFENITYRKNIELALKESEEKYREVFNNANDAVFLHRLREGEPLKFLEVNNIACHMSGYTQEELLQMIAQDIITPETIRKIPQIMDTLLKEGRTTFEAELISKKGEKFPVEISSHFFTMQGENYIISVARDITQRKATEKALRVALDEKELLLKEIHHRVKNNLMIISSLLDLQSQYITDKESKSVFKESQNRARSMALIHERLYQSIDLKNLDFGDYIRTLSNELFRTYTDGTDRVKLIINVEDLSLDINTAIPLGLIVNELVTNSLKHAFHGGISGQINIDFHLKDDHYEFTVKDDGIGLPDNLDYQNTDTLGLQMVTMLTSQIDGEIQLNRTGGTEFRITFTGEKI